MGKAHIIGYYLVRRFISRLIILFIVVCPQISLAKAVKEFDINFGYTLLSLNHQESGVPVDFSGPLVTGEFSLLFKKIFEFGLTLQYQELANPYVDEFDSREVISAGGGGLSFAGFFNKSKTLYIKTDILYNLFVIDQLDGLVSKSHKYSSIGSRIGVGYTYKGKKFSFSISQSLELHLLSGGEDTLYPNHEIGELVGVGSSTLMGFGMVFR